MLRNSTKYFVDCYQSGQYDDATIHKEYKTYKGATAFAIKWSKLNPFGRVEVIDVGTDRDYYEEDICARQEYINGTLEMDGRPLRLSDRINHTGKAIIIKN